ncbi:MAG: hypothetical protein MJ128_05330 [Mogibacterium sp.]|nr:hypothetical protein [Mogibacterium sp.]
MKTIRPIEVAECCNCGEEFDIIKMKRLFTGRVRYMCPECYARANRQLSAKRSEWMSSTKGKQAIAISERKK